MIDSSAQGAWRELEARLRPFIGARLRAEADVDDVLQDVFLRIQRGLPSLRDDQRFGPWVYRIARNAIIDHQRSAARRPVPMAELPERAEAGAEALDEHLGHDPTSYVASFVAALPSPYREALTLTELEGLSQREAAERLGISVSGMKSRVQRGRGKLRAALEACCHFALDSHDRVIGYQPRDTSDTPDGCCD